MNQKSVTIALPFKQYALFQQKASAQRKEVGQLGAEIIRHWLRQQTELKENTASESKDEQALEAAYREYYAHAEEDLRIVRNMRGTQMRAFESHQEKNGCPIP